MSDDLPVKLYHGRPAGTQNVLDSTNNKLVCSTTERSNAVVRAYP